MHLNLFSDSLLN